MDIYELLHMKADDKRVGAAVIAYSIGLLAPGLHLLLAPLYFALGVAGLLVGGGYLVTGVALVRRQRWAKHVVVAVAGAHLTVGVTLLSLMATVSVR